MNATGSQELTGLQKRMIDLIAYLAVNLVDHPADVTVTLIEQQGREIYQLRVHADDLGKVIGKGGQTARALRTLLSAANTQADRRMTLEIVE